MERRFSTADDAHPLSGNGLLKLARVVNIQRGCFLTSRDEFLKNGCSHNEILGVVSSVSCLK